jgi:hypothetical protein
MKTWIQQALAGALLGALVGAQAAPVIGPLDGATAVQSAVTAGQYDRWDTDFAFQESDLAVLTGAGSQAYTAPLRAVGSSVTVQYLGTLAAHSGTLFLSGVGDLFSLRSGLDAATAAADFSTYIDSIGQSLTISNLSAFDELTFGLQADAYAGVTSPYIPGNGASTVLAGVGGGARAVSLGGNDWLIGFETFGATDYADAVLRVSGVTFDSPPQSSGLPAPGSLSLALAALGAAAWALRRTQHAGCRQPGGVC